VFDDLTITVRLAFDDDFFGSAAQRWHDGEERLHATFARLNLPLPAGSRLTVIDEATAAR